MSYYCIEQSTAKYARKYLQCTECNVLNTPSLRYVIDSQCIERPTPNGLRGLGSTAELRFHELRPSAPLASIHADAYRDWDLRTRVAKMAACFGFRWFENANGRVDVYSVSWSVSFISMVLFMFFYLVICSKQRRACFHCVALHLQNWF